ncbi:Sodium-dependent dicarboxylate transporter SdcS [Stieleria neptunia]|uniref:Sodium-dependent dicarboxylate transporter SdcS n=1 Tax=Stieleria neptunia TaxID=2527979 RepID=A0A518HLA2_9BACT|nr:SLC13 family permease [Stieleria neptunia]QDV41632.1 Sodium-dependent dicarboxylate transporter SdcS [Stieleria neptunia]
MIWEAWLSLAVSLGLLASLATRIASTDLLAMVFLAVLVIVQDLTGTPNLPSPAEAVLGFGNQGLLTIALLFAVVAGLEMTGGTKLATGWFLDRAKTFRDAQLRILLPVAMCSGFLNNTPVVAALMPIVDDVCKRLGASASRLLLPLSYAAILGGMCTVMGTSTNLIVREEFEAKHDGEISFFAPAVVGVPAAILGVGYMILFSTKLIPARKAAVSASDDPKQYTVEMQVDPHGPLVGKSIQDAGLRSLPGLYIAEIQRGDSVIPAKPIEKLQADDALILVGALESVVDLRKTRGLLTPDDQGRKLEVPAWRRTLIEAVVSPRCSLLGKTIREGRFRSNYNAAVVAVARGDRRLTGKIGNVELETGDVLLLEASPSFLHRAKELRDFYLVSRVGSDVVRRHDHAWHAIVIMVAMVLIAALKITSILTAALAAALAMILLRCCTASEARRSVDWSILIVIGATIGIGRSLETSGAAQAIAQEMINLAGGNPRLSLALVYLVTMLCTELITNTAAGLIMLTIAIGAAGTLGVSEVPFVIAVMVAASASFLTPFGYQTNLMVYTVGGYRASDYLRFGLPLSLIVFAVSMVVIPIAFPFVVPPPLP